MIEYEFEVKEVSDYSMILEYKSVGRETVKVGARLPTVGETMEAVARQYAPLAWWQLTETVYLPPVVGAKGAVVKAAEPVVTLETLKAVKRAEAAAWRYSVETSGVTLGGVRILTDRESQAQLSGAFTSLKNGLIDSVDWKANGVFRSFNLAEITMIASAVASHVQASFTSEKDLVELIDAVETVEELNAIVIG